MEMLAQTAQLGKKVNLVQLDPVDQQVQGQMDLLVHQVQEDFQENLDVLESWVMLELEGLLVPLVPLDLEVLLDFMMAVESCVPMPALLAHQAILVSRE
ncbi:UNVERIFIED_CONTAM: hypothetical protein FKN15_029338 [Acipenser sinensis]